MSDKFNNWLKFISNKVKTAREKRGITQHDLSKLSFLSQKYIKSIENATTSPCYYSIVKIAECLNDNTLINDYMNYDENEKITELKTISIYKKKY